MALPPANSSKRVVGADHRFEQSGVIHRLLYELDGRLPAVAQLRVIDAGSRSSAMAG